MKEKKYKTLKEFWPFYLGEHANKLNRLLHVLGNTLGLTWLGIALFTSMYWLILIGLVNAYGLSWIGHFIIEKNRPATFTYPLYSFTCDFIMVFYMYTGQIKNQLKKYNIQ